MSWSEYYGPNKFTVSEIFALEPSSEHTVRDQFDVARKVAGDLAASGVVGDPSKHKFNVTLSGHGNTDHEPALGWANDAVSVSVAQAVTD